MLQPYIGSANALSDYINDEEIANFRFLSVKPTKCECKLEI